jgi:hypothetical protein
VGITFGGQATPAITTIWSYRTGTEQAPSPALEALIAARASLALAPAEQQQLEAAATRGDITLDEAQKIVAIDTRLDEIERVNGDDNPDNNIRLGTKADGTPLSVDDLRAQFAEARAAMIAPDNKHEGQIVEQELGALVAMVPQDAGLSRAATGRGA